MGERFSFSAGKEAIISYTILLIFFLQKKARGIQSFREREREQFQFCIICKYNFLYRYKLCYKFCEGKTFFYSFREEPKKGLVGNKRVVVVRRIWQHQIAVVAIYFLITHMLLFLLQHHYWYRIFFSVYSNKILIDIYRDIEQSVMLVAKRGKIFHSC